MKWTLWFFGICALFTLGVSIPATYDALKLWHGPELGVFALLVFEVGAVGAKLATLAIPEWRGRLTLLTIVLLSITTGANYAHGYDLSQAAVASPTLAAVLSDPLGAVLATLATAALFPALLFVFLSAFVSRCEVYAKRRGALADAREELAVLRDSLATACAENDIFRAQLAAERERPVLVRVEDAVRVLAAHGAPESTMRTWMESGRLRLAAPGEGE